MKMPSEKIIFGAAVAWWALVAWIVVDYNVGLGTTTLRWPNLKHSSAAWSWDATEATPSLLEANGGQWLRVTLPRGFSTATLEVQTVFPSELVVRAETLNNQPLTQASSGANHSLSFAWRDLIARGKTFRFRVENHTTRPIELKHIHLTTGR